MNPLTLNFGGCVCCLARAPQQRRSNFISTHIGAASVSAGASAAGPRHLMPRSGRLRLDGGKIVNPRDGSIVSGMSVVLDQGRIVALEPAGLTRTNKLDTVIDANGKYIVPGYNDMHSHVLELADPSGSLALMLAEGVTGFRQMSGSPELLEQRRMGTLPVGKDAPAALELPGSLLTPLNSASREAVVSEIALQKQQGADFVKAGFVSPEVFLAALQAAKEQGIRLLGHLQDGVDAAVACKAGFASIEHLGPGATVWIACSSAEERLKTASRPAIKSLPVRIAWLEKLILWRMQTMLINPAAFAPPQYIEKLQQALDSFSEEKCRALCALFVEHGTWHVPTLVRLRTQELADLPEYANDPYLRFMPQNKIRKWRAVTRKFTKLPATMRQTYTQAYRQQLGLTKLLADNGVRMMTGSDGGWLSGPGLTLQEEFVQLGAAGLSPLQVLQMTTLNAAQYLGRTATMGTVEPGRNADLVLLDANPFDNVASLGRIAAVVRAGFYYSRVQLDALRERVAEGRGALQ